MERISGKKRKRRIPPNKVIYFAIFISLIVLVVFISINYKNKDEVIIYKLDFIDVGYKVYLKFKIKNPTDEQKTCSLNIRFAGKEYNGYVNVSAKSKKDYRILREIPQGKTEVRLEYSCT